MAIKVQGVYRSWQSASVFEYLHLHYLPCVVLRIRLMFHRKILDRATGLAFGVQRTAIMKRYACDRLEGALAENE